MATFRNRKYPELTVLFSDRTKVNFKKGEVEVDADTADRLAQFAEEHPEYGIEYDAPTRRSRRKPKPKPKPEPKDSAEESGEDDGGNEAEQILGKA